MHQYHDLRLKIFCILNLKKKLKPFTLLALSLIDCITSENDNKELATLFNCVESLTALELILSHVDEDPFVKTFKC